MKLTKTTIALAAIAGLLVLSPAAPAQPATNHATNGAPPAGGRRGMSVDNQLTRLSEQLKLTDEQKPKVKAVLEEQIKQMQGLRDLSQEERRTRMPALREETNKKMKEILTPEQFKQYEEMQQQRVRRGQGGPGGPPPTNQPAPKPDAK